MNKSIMKFMLLLSLLVVVMKHVESLPLEQKQVKFILIQEVFIVVNPYFCAFFKQHELEETGVGHVEDNSQSEEDVARFLEALIEKYPSLAIRVFANELEKAETEQQNMQNVDYNGDNENNRSMDRPFSRERRRLSVFKNIYQKCRIQKRKDKDMCLYLANLYQNVKGFHGL
jgi:hypothetical protein